MEGLDLESTEMLESELRAGDEPCWSSLSWRLALIGGLRDEAAKMCNSSLGAVIARKEAVALGIEVHYQSGPK